MLSHPGAKVETRGNDRVVSIPMYDLDTDSAWVEERKVIKDADETRMGMLPVFEVRKGAKFNPDGEPKTGAMGQLYRIVGWTPPKKEDSD